MYAPGSGPPTIDIDHVGPRHQVCVYAQHRWRTLPNDIEQFLAVGKRGIEDLNLHTFPAQVRTDVEDPQRRIWLHDLKLLGVLVQEIAVREQ